MGWLIRFKWLLLVDVAIIAYLIYVLLSTPGVQGYEVSIYAAYPMSFWIVYVLGWSINLFIILHTKNSIITHGALVVLIVLTLVLGLLPLQRDYVCVNSGDSLTHLTYVNNAVSDGYLGLDNYHSDPYPFSHILATGLCSFGISPEDSIQIVPVILYFWYVLYVYMLSRKLTDNYRKAAIITAIALIPALAIYYFYPSILSVYILPSLAYFIITRNWLMIGLLTILLPLAHPISSAVYAVYIAVILLLLLIQKVSLSLRNVAPLLLSILILGISLSGVLFNLRQQVAPVMDVVSVSMTGTTVTNETVIYEPPPTQPNETVIYEPPPNQPNETATKEPPPSQPNETATKEPPPNQPNETAIYEPPTSQFREILQGLELAQLSTSDIIELYILRYGVLHFIYGMGLVYSVITLIRWTRRVVWERTISILCLASFILYIVSFFVSEYLILGRMYTYTLLVSLIPAGLLIWRIRERLRWGAARVALALMLCLVSMVGVFTLYDSPINKKPNQQVTHAELDALSWLLINKEPGLKVYDLLYRQPRQLTYLVGKEYYEKTDWKNYGARGLPYHFGYDRATRLGELMPEDCYLMTDVRNVMVSTQVYPEHSDKWAYTPDDYTKLGTDNSLKLLYNRDGIKIYFVRHINEVNENAEG